MQLLSIILSVTHRIIYNCREYFTFFEAVISQAISGNYTKYSV